MNYDIQMGATYTFFKNGVEVGSTKNLLTNGFFNRLFDSNVFNSIESGRYICVFVGTGTTPVAETDTGMESNVATSTINDSVRTSNFFNYQDVTTSGGANFGHYDWGVNFSAGTFSGQTITEVGARFSATTSANRNTPTVIDSHALIADANGNITGITLGAGDALSIAVKFTMKFPYQERSTFSYNGSTYTASFNAIMVGDLTSTDDGLAYWSPFNQNTGGSAFMLIRSGIGKPTLPSTSSVWGWTAMSQSGTQTNHEPNVDVPNMGSNAHTTTAINWDSGSKTWSMTKVIGGVTLLTSTGLGRFTFGNTSGGHFGSIVFNPRLTGVGSFFTLGLSFKFGQLSPLNEEITMTTLSNPTTITETVANGLSTTIGEGRAIVQSGGTAPFTYAWAYVSGGSALLSAVSASSESTTFTGTGTAQSSNELWRCTITDSSGTPQVQTVDVQVNVTWA